MNYTIERITPPAILPVSVEEIKAQQRIDGIDEDALIERLIRAATEHFDALGDLGRAIITQTWAQWEMQSPGWVRLRIGNFQSLDAIEYYDEAGVFQSANIADFETWRRGDLMTLKPRDNAEWPNSDTRPDAIKITYTAGYGDTAADVPENVRHAIILMVSHWYNHREAVTDVNLMPVPMGVEALINNERLGWYG